jgi:hypothetical protein
MQNYGKLHYVRMNVSPIIVGAGSSRKYIPNPDMVGISDLQVWLPGGVHLSIECKRAKGGVLSPGQRSFKARLDGLGHHYFVVKSCAELEVILRKFNCTL